MNKSISPKEAHVRSKFSISAISLVSSSRCPIEITTSRDLEILLIEKVIQFHVGYSAARHHPWAPRIAVPRAPLSLRLAVKTTLILSRSIRFKVARVAFKHR